jgi:hypothetical protein
VAKESAIFRSFEYIYLFISLNVYLEIFLFYGFPYQFGLAWGPETIENSAGADGVPRSRVCAR